MADVNGQGDAVIGAVISLVGTVLVALIGVWKQEVGNRKPTGGAQADEYREICQMHEEHIKALRNRIEDLLEENETLRKRLEGYEP